MLHFTSALLMHYLFSGLAACLLASTALYDIRSCIKATSGFVLLAIPIADFTVDEFFSAVNNSIQVEQEIREWMSSTILKRCKAKNEMEFTNYSFK